MSAISAGVVRPTCSPLSAATATAQRIAARPTVSSALTPGAVTLSVVAPGVRYSSAAGVDKAPDPQSAERERRGEQQHEHDDERRGQVADPADARDGADLRGVDLGVVELERALRGARLVDRLALGRRRLAQLLGGRGAADRAGAATAVAAGRR